MLGALKTTFDGSKCVLYIEQPLTCVLYIDGGGSFVNTADRSVALAVCVLWCTRVRNAWPYGV